MLKQAVRRSIAASRLAATPAAAFRPSSLAAVAGARFTSYGNVRRHTDTQSTPANLGFCIVPQQSAYVIERLGKFRTVLQPGFHVLIPMFDRIAYVHSLKEEAVHIAQSSAITKDNVVLQIDGVLYLKIVDPVQASYGVSDPFFALSQLAQTTMRSELGKITLDQVFEEREALNNAVSAAINSAAKDWGVSVLRYEIRDITPPAGVRAAMEMQAEAERRKRAEILESEGHKQAAINNAEGKKAAIILVAEAESSAILARAKAEAAAVGMTSKVLSVKGGFDAASLILADRYVGAFSKLAKTGNTILMPADAGNVAGMVTQAMATFKAIRGAAPSSGSNPDAPEWMEEKDEDAPVSRSLRLEQAAEDVTAPEASRADQVHRAHPLHQSQFSQQAEVPEQPSSFVPKPF